jgi:hypothetical protein
MDEWCIADSKQLPGRALVIGDGHCRPMTRVVELLLPTHKNESNPPSTNPVKASETNITNMILLFRHGRVLLLHFRITLRLSHRLLTSL